MIGLGVVAGLLLRGSFKNLKEINFRLTAVLFVSLIVALLPLIFDSLNPHRRVLSLISLAGVLIFLIANISAARGPVRIGFGIIALGWALNFIVIAANGGMPLSEWAYRTSGQTTAITYGTGGFYRSVHTDSGTLFRQLSDVIPIKPYRQVVSIGDLLLIVGVAFVIAAGMRSRASVTAERASVPVEQPAK
jgi:hypothetical protein